MDITKHPKKIGQKHNGLIFLVFYPSNSHIDENTSIYRPQLSVGWTRGCLWLHQRMEKPGKLCQKKEEEVSESC